jgi:hypothetical protein
VSVDKFDPVDIISIDQAGGAVLRVSDHLDWSDSLGHQTILQEKLNRYLAFVESGEIFERYPDAKDRPVLISVVFKFRPDRDGEEFLVRAKGIVESAGFEFRHELFAESYDN